VFLTEFTSQYSLNTQRGWHISELEGLLASNFNPNWSSPHSLWHHLYSVRLLLSSYLSLDLHFSVYMNPSHVRFFFVLPYFLYHLSWQCHSLNITLRVQIMNLLILHFSPDFCHFLLFTFKNFSRKALSPTFSLYTVLIPSKQSDCCSCRLF